MRLITATLVKGIAFGLLVASCGGALAAVAAEDAAPAKRVNFKRERASAHVRQMADWVLASGDNGGLPYMLVDKTDARVFLFHADGQLGGAAPALLGLAVGDESVPGIGQRSLASIRPEERTTPAGRFVANLDRDLQGKALLWVDYDSSLSLHPVVTGKAEERRAQRLATPTPLDNRISYGCINVPVNFFKRVISPAFKGTNGIVYVLPENRASRDQPKPIKGVDDDQWK